MNKVRNIQLSLTCFRLGLAGLVPVLGFPLAILAAVHYWQALGRCVGWNPARKYLVIGGCLGGLGVLVGIMEFTLIGSIWVGHQ